MFFLFTTCMCVYLCVLSFENDVEKFLYIINKTQL